MQRSLNLNLYIRSSWLCIQKLQFFSTRINSVYYQQLYHLKAIEISVDIYFELCCRSKKFFTILLSLYPHIQRTVANFPRLMDCRNKEIITTWTKSHRIKKPNLNRERRNMNEFLCHQMEAMVGWSSCRLLIASFVQWGTHPDSHIIYNDIHLCWLNNSRSAQITSI